MDANTETMHVGLLGGIISALAHIANAVPAAAGLVPAVNRLAANHALLQDAMTAAAAAAAGNEMGAIIAGAEAVGEVAQSIEGQPAEGQDHTADEPMPAG